VGCAAGTASPISKAASARLDLKHVAWHRKRPACRARCTAIHSNAHAHGAREFMPQPRWEGVDNGGSSNSAEASQTRATAYLDRSLQFQQHRLRCEHFPALVAKPLDLCFCQRDLPAWSRPSDRKQLVDDVVHIHVLHLLRCRPKCGDIYTCTRTLGYRSMYLIDLIDEPFVMRLFV